MEQRTREENIAIIRAACIKANPEGRWTEYGPGVAEDANGNLIAEIRPRQIRLADVVGALRHAKGSGYANNYAAWTLQVIGFWPLRDDRLEALKDEDLTFLANLLTFLANLLQGSKQ